MSLIIDLNAMNGKLLLVIENEFWCKVHLVNKEKKKYIGGDSIKIIKERIGEKLNLLSSQTTSNFEIEKQKVSWLISLLDRHTTIFATNDKNPVDLYFLYENMEIDEFDKLTLSENDIIQWCTKLKAI